MTQGLILLGGLGTRLRPLTLHQPKPLLPILNRPFLSYQILALKRAGVREVVLALGHKAAHFRRALGNGARWGVRFVYSVEKKPLGTGGAMGLAARHIQDTTIILNGDVFADFDLKGLLASHRQRKARVTLTLVEVEDPSAFGVVRLDPQGAVKAFVEKPPAGTVPDRTINAGCYVFEPSVFRDIPWNRPVSVERETFPGLLNVGAPVYGVIHRGYWSDIGTLPSYWKTHADLHRQKSILDRLGVKKVFWKKGGGVHPTARVTGSLVLGAGARVGPETVLEGPVTLGAGVVVGKGARLSQCVVLDNTRIGERSVVERSVVGAHSVIGADARVGPGQVVGDRARLPEFSQVLPNLYG